MMDEDEKETQSPDDEGLELDKLEVPDRPAEDRAPESSSTATASDNPAKTRTTPRFYLRLPAFVLDKAFFIPVLTAILISALVLLVPFEGLFTEDKNSENSSIGRIAYTVSSYLGVRHTVRFTLFVEYTDTGEKQAFVRSLPRLKEALAASGDLPEVKEAIDDGNLNQVEKHILTVVGDITGAPLDRLKIKRLHLE